MSSSTATNSIAKRSSDGADASSTDASHLCDNCSSLGLKIKQFHGKKDEKIHFTTRKWVENNFSTCVLCKIIWRSHRLHPLYNFENLFIYSINHMEDGVHTLFLRTEESVGLDIVNLALLTSNESPAAREGHISGRFIKPAADLDCARRWLNDCLRDHDHGSNTALSRPSRLIAVGTEDSAQSIVLVNGATMDEEYVALSYCWGQGVTLRTTKATLNTFQTFIPWNQLPKTFQDALQVARGLCIKYIWIDSLCIVQDDPEDWATESAKMADIYSGALMTIMAAMSTNSEGGCFPNRPPAPEMIRLPYTDETGITSLCVCARPSVLRYTGSIFNGPLFRRAWVFQERYLSKRKLIFNKDQTYWDCNGLVQPESRVLPVEGNLSISSVTNRYFQIFSDPGVQVSGNSFFNYQKLSFNDLWAAIVSEYSCCSLTFETDILPPLSGLARNFAQRSGYTYAAGLWLEQMPISLLWSVVPLERREQQERQYCAPSWSWASTKGIYVRHTPSAVLELELLRTEIILASTDPYGKVAPGSRIIVKGRVRAAQLVRRPGYSRNRYGKIDDQTLIEDDDGNSLRLKLLLDEEREDLPLTITCLEVSNRANDKLYPKLAQYLVLQATGNDMEFRRIGYSEFDGSDPELVNPFLGIKKTVITLV